MVVSRKRKKRQGGEKNRGVRVRNCVFFQLSSTGGTCPMTLRLANLPSANAASGS